MFVLLSFPRCGTHMLRTALNSHPQVMCLGEIFNPKHPHGTRGAKSVKTVLDSVRRVGQSGSSIGFAVHYHNDLIPLPTATSVAWPHLWRELPNLLPEDAFVILLRRRDLLRRHVSHLIATQTQQWTWTTGYEKRNPQPFYVDLGLLEADIAWFKRAYLEVEKLFPAAHYVSYESLVNDWGNQAELLQHALGVSTTSIRPETIQQAVSLSETVLNYGDVLREFGGQL